MTESTLELKQLFKKDIEALKSIDVPILPAKIMYGRLARTIASFFGLLMVTTYTVMMITYAIIGLDPEYYGNLSDMVFCNMLFAFIISLLASFVASPLLNKYVIFQLIFRENLQTGGYLSKKIRQLAKIAWSIFFVLMLFIDLMFMHAASFSMIFSLFLCLFIVPTVIDFEIDRLGISVFFDAVSEFIDKKKSPTLSD